MGLGKTLQVRSLIEACMSENIDSFRHYLCLLGWKRTRLVCILIMYALDLYWLLKAAYDPQLVICPLSVLQSWESVSSHFGVWTFVKCFRIGSGPMAAFGINLAFSWRSHRTHSNQRSYSTWGNRTTADCIHNLWNLCCGRFMVQESTMDVLCTWWGSQDQERGHQYCREAPRPWMPLSLE